MGCVVRLWGDRNIRSGSWGHKLNPVPALFGVFREEHVAGAPPVIFVVHNPVQRCDSAGQQVRGDLGLDPRLAAGAEVVPPPNRLRPALDGHIQRPSLLGVDRDLGQDPFRAVLWAGPPWVAHVGWNILEPPCAPGPINQADAVPFCCLSRCTDHDVGLYVVTPVEMLHEVFGRLDGWLGVTLPQSVGLYVADL